MDRMTCEAYGSSCCTGHLSWWSPKHVQRTHDDDRHWPTPSWFYAPGPGRIDGDKSLRNDGPVVSRYFRHCFPKRSGDHIIKYTIEYYYIVYAFPRRSFRSISTATFKIYFDSGRSGSHCSGIVPIDDDNYHHNNIILSLISIGTQQRRWLNCGCACDFNLSRSVSSGSGGDGSS